MGFRSTAALSLVGLLAATSLLGSSQQAFSFEDVAEEVGVGAVTWCGRAEKPHILESGGTGIALFDYDGDGALDLYVVNGWRLEGATVADRGRDVLYRNRGDGTFVDVTRSAGLGHDGWGAGVAVGDVDGDGHLDLFVTDFGPDVLYRNRGDGTFESVPDAPGIDGWSAGAVLFDADADGDEDLYVAGYIECTLEEVLAAEPRLEWQGFDVMLGPFGLEGEGNRYFENLGELRFRDATAEAGLADPGLYYSFAVAAVDLDGDRHLDLYVANDSNPNYLYQSQGDGTFQEVGLWSGASLDEGGMAQAGMGLAVGDLDDDRLAELLVTNFYMDTTTLYANRGDLVFEDVTRPWGLYEPTFLPLSWGASFDDLDLDGDQDLFIANGHIYPQADEAPPDARTSYAQTNLLLAREEGRFVDVSSSSGRGLAVRASSRGLSVGDLDGDGDLDLVVSNCDEPPHVLRNQSSRQGRWLIVDAPAAVRVELALGERRVVRHKVVGGSFVSAHDRRHHFGLGDVERVDRVSVLWPDGSRSALEDVPVDHVLRLTRTGSARRDGGEPRRPEPGSSAPQ